MASVRHSRGYALMMALLAVVAVSLATVVAVSNARVEAQREHEEQLLWAGNQIRQALWRYSTLPVAKTAGTQYPQKLEELLEDHRLPSVVRHLRRIYPDPFTGKADWVLELDGDRIIGVHSSSTRAPLRHAGYGPGNETFADAQSYSDWHFRAANAQAAAAGAANAAPSAGAPGAPLAGAGDSSAPGSDPSSNPATPAPPVDPNLSARQNCYLQFAAPKSQCTQLPPPAGHDVISCLKTLTEQLNACMAGVGQ